MRRTSWSFLLTIFMLNAVISQQGPDRENGFLVRPYLQFSTKTSIRILWETKVASTSIVQYGKAVEKSSNGPILDKEVVLNGKRMMHEVALNDLEEETNYFWKVISKNETGQIESEVYTFKSVVKDSTAFMFALISDTQRNKRTPWAWDSIAKVVWKERPNFVVNAGDLVDWGHNKEEWVHEFLGPGHDLMSRVPMYTVLGNHEGDADYYYQYMANPAPEYCYTFRYGNAEFFMIDSNRDLSEGSDQYNWLEQQLAKSTATWKIAVHHHPPYSSESDDHGRTFDGEMSKMGHAQVRDLPKLYDTYGVDFSLFGHTHVYERTWPLRDNRINQRKGTIYINAGGAGGGLETFAPTRNWFTLEIQEGHHYCTFAIYDKDIVFKAIDHQGRVFDTFHLNKDRDKDEVQIQQPPAPLIQSEKFSFHDQTMFTLEAGLEGLTLKYTLDGSEPSMNSPEYRSPVKINKNTTVRARAYTRDGKASRTVSKQFVEMPIAKSKRVRKPDRGLSYKIYEGNWEGNKGTFMQPANMTREGIMKTLTLHDIKVDNERWAIEIRGYIKIPKTDTYTFYGHGSRGLLIELDGTQIIKRDHEKQAVVQRVLEEGYHEVVIKSFQTNWRKALGFGFWNDTTGRIPIAPFDLAH